MQMLILMRIRTLLITVNTERRVTVIRDITGKVLTEMVSLTEITAEIVTEAEWFSDLEASRRMSEIILINRQFAATGV